jgi:hypothetical protein
LDGLAIFATSDLFRVNRLQRPVRELAIVADSFHTSRSSASCNRRINIMSLGSIGSKRPSLQGNLYALDEVELAPGFPRTHSEVVKIKEGQPEWKNRVYGPSGPGRSTRHGTNVRQEDIDTDTERFFRAVNAAVLEHYSRTSRAPLVLAALPEYHHLFRAVSRNPFLTGGTIDSRALYQSMNYGSVFGSCCSRFISSGPAS